MTTFSSLLRSVLLLSIVFAMAVGSPSSCSKKKLFGVKMTNVLSSLRGGEVLEAKTLEELETILLKADNSLVVIDFSASWCGPCKMIAPMFEELSEKMGNVTFVKTDVDENPDAAARYSVTAMPTFLFVRDGRVMDRLMGANPLRLQELIAEYQVPEEEEEEDDEEEEKDGEKQKEGEEGGIKGEEDDTGGEE